ncbi:hypothetical protein [Riemerella columbina]|uniref:hypothetical protein n=1 Tax=Riemerella columbina TaxID=103810 RepID=UPI00037743CF|nr:hypothetical protein [Riemerella columbina]
MEQKTFNLAWWDEFLSKSERLSKTTVINDCINKSETYEMRCLVFQILKVIIENRVLEYGIRIFVEGKLLNKEELNDFLYNSKPYSEESFEDWSSRCFNGKKYGIIINRGEKFSPKLVEKVASKINILMEKIGIPRLGVTFTIFIGNYGWTPIGIHTDGIGENVMHFHLGQGGKKMYTWDKNTYESNVAEEYRYNNKNIEQILDKAKLYSFEEGDIYYMPSGEYHVGKSDDLSIGLTLWFNNHTKGMLSRKIFNTFYNENFTDISEILDLDTSSENDISNFQDIDVTFKNIDNIKNNNFYDLLKNTYKDYKIALYSNCGFWEPPFPKLETLDTSKNYRVRIISPFKIYYYTDDKLNLFIRGNKMRMLNDLSITRLLDKINSGDWVSKNEVHNLLSSQWGEEVKNYLLANLFSQHILEVVYEKNN